ncbi:MAG: hypothetical protein WAV25_00455 [Minisyncoccia bacterium]
MVDPISIFWVIIGVLLWPELTLCIILWKLGHPYLGVYALIFAETTKTSVKTIIKERVIDSHTKRVVSERTIKE